MFAELQTKPGRMRKQNPLSPAADKPWCRLMAREALFDLAVNRALSYAQKLKLDLSQSDLEEKLEPWHKNTRFVYRIPLNIICLTLKTLPEKNMHWQGGQNGSWLKGKSPHP